jgi:hypothetical protein
MPYRRLIEWEAFEEEFGPLTLHRRIEAGFALMMQQQAAFHGIERPLDDFLPRWEWESGEEGPHIADWLSAVARKP